MATLLCNTPYHQAQLDNFVQLACFLCDAPAAVLSFVGFNSEASSAVKGLTVSGNIDHSKVLHEVKQSSRLVSYSDIQQDPQFCNDVLIVKNPNLQFCIGVPLIVPNTTLHIGALCVFDTQVRPVLSSKAQLALELLGEQMMEVFQLWGEAHAKEQLFKRCLPLICHELNTPLNGIVGLSTLSNLPEGETILKSAGVALRVLEQLEEFSHLQQGELKLRLAPFDMRECVEDTIGEMKPLLTHLSVRYELIRNCRLVGDQRRLKQVLHILLENAGKFTATGEVLLKVVCPEENKGGAENPSEFLFEVHDTGVGISSDIAGQLFQPFGVGDGSSTREQGGTGLGLAIAQTICKAMQGRIWFTSEEKQGSCFSFTINASTQPERMESAVLGHHPLSCMFDDTPLSETEKDVFSLDISDDAKGLAVLVVDDNRINQKVLVGFMHRMGYFPDIACNGEEMLAAFDEKHYDLVLTDIEMPSMDGIEATRRLRSKYGPNVPYIVGVSANTLGSNRQRCLDAGMQKFLPKPIRYDAVKQAVDTVLSQWAQNSKMKTCRPRLLQRLPSKPDTPPSNSPLMPFPPMHPLQPVQRTKRLGVVSPPSLLSPKAPAGMDCGLLGFNVPCPPAVPPLHPAKYSRLRGQ